MKGILSSNQIEMIMRIVDSDMNGAISYSEFIAATINEKVLSNTLKIEKAFEFFDKDHNGLISTVELKQILLNETNFSLVNEDFIQLILDEIDVEKDGEIDYHIFARCLSLKSFQK